MSDELLHVMALRPRQQACLRLLMQDLYCAFIEKHVSDLQDVNTASYVDTKIKMLVTAFDQYNQLINLLANRETVLKAQHKVITVSPVMMRQIVIAVENYDQTAAVLDESDKNFIKLELRSLRELIAQSKEYTYTSNEIEKMRSSL
jgi:hypothetical protein